MASTDTEFNLTKGLLETILNSYHKSQSSAPPNVQIRDWTSKGATGKRSGFLSEQISATVQYEAQAEELSAHLQFKLLPQDQHMLNLIHENDFVVREMRFYTEVLPALANIEKACLGEEDLAVPWVPRLFYANADDWENSPLVLENMCPQGYKIQDFIQGLSYKQAKASMEAIAKFHAASVALEAREGKPLSESFTFLFPLEKAVECFAGLIETCFPTTLSFLSRAGREAEREVLLRFSAENNWRDLVRRVLSSAGKLLTLLHYDYWSNNLLVRSQGEDVQCCIIDWQMLGYGRPALDVSLMIWSSLTPSERRQHGHTLRSDYWEAFTSRLRKFGIEINALNYSKDDFDQDFKVADLVTGIILLGSTDVPDVEERYVEVFTDLIRDKIIC